MACGDGRQGGGPPRAHRRGAGGARAAIGRSLESVRHARRQCARRIRIPPRRLSCGGRRAMIRASAAGVYWLPASDGPRAGATVLTVGLIARLVLLPVVPTLSTDIYRYVWDARVAHIGISPYAYPPSARELEPLRDLALFP